MRKPSISGFIEFIFSHPRSLIGLILLLTLFFLYCFSRQSHNNHINVFFESADPSFAAYLEFQDIFGNEEFAVVALEHEDLFSNEKLAVIRRLTNALERVDGVERVVSLTSVEEFTGTEDAVFLRHVVPRGRLSSAELSEARKRALDNRFVSEHMLTPDARMTALHVELEYMGEKRKRNCASRILEVSKNTAGDHFDLNCSGPSLIEVEMNRLSERDFYTYIPVILALIFVFMIFLLWQPALAVLSEINLLVILSWSVGLYVLCGEKFNIITSTMGAIVLAIAVADSIHIASHFKETLKSGRLERSAALAETVRQVWFPCLFTSLTTGAGFASFCISDIRPVAVLGLYTAVSVVLAFALSVTALPGLILCAGKWSEKPVNKRKSAFPGRVENDFFTAALRSLGVFVVRRRKELLILFLALLGLAFAGMSRLEFETNTFTYLPDSNRIKKDFKVIEKNFGGTIPFIVWIKALEGRSFETPETLKLVDAVQKRLLSGNEELTHAFSVVNYIKEFNKAINGDDSDEYRIPGNRLDIIDAYELGDPAVLDRTISLDRSQVCITFLSTWKSNEAGYKLHDSARRYLREKLGSGYSFNITGLSSLYLKMDRNLRQGQQRSFIIAFLIIFLVMLFVCRGFWLAVFSMVPNLFPIVLTLGLMGWTGIPLDVATTMISSVTIGIAVDDTIHVVAWMRRNTGLNSDRGEAVVETFTDVGKPVVITTLLLFAGFYVLMLGSILPTRMFGMLTAFSMFFALIGDIFFLPPLVLVFKPRIPPLLKKEPEEKRLRSVQ